jgi:hypothetical protein
MFNIIHEVMVMSTANSMKSVVKLKLPKEFLDLCKEHKIDPEFVLRGFIADLCDITSFNNNPRMDGYNSNGSDERHLAKEYYNRVGYPFWNDEDLIKNPN